MDLKHLSTKQKVLLFGGAGVVLLFLLKAVTSHGASGSSTASAADQSNQLQNMLDQFSQANAQQSQSIIGAITQNDQGLAQAISQLGQSQTQANTQLLTGMTSLFQSYQQNQTATAVTANPAPSHSGSIPTPQQAAQAVGLQPVNKWSNVNGTYYVGNKVFTGQNALYQAKNYATQSGQQAMELNLPGQ